MNIKNPSTLFFLALLCIVFGVFFSFFAPFTTQPVLFVCLFISSTLLITLGHAFLGGAHKILFAILTFLFLLIGVIRYDIVNHSVSYMLPHGARTGTVVTNPTTTTYGQSFLFKTTRDEKVLVRYSGSAPVEYGNELTLGLDCSRPKSFETDLGSTFDYARYLAKDHVYSVCTTNAATLKDPHHSFQQSMYRFSNNLGGRIDELFSSPHSDFIGGVLVGDKSSIDNDLRNDFIKTGTIHILALSGYNIAIVALFFQRFFYLFLRKRGALICAGISVILFVAMTGFSASAIRAGIMAVIVIMAQLSYQKYSPLRALLFASFLMILYDPFYLIYDSSFHLSFLATFGIITLTPLLDQYFKRIHWNPLRIAVTTTLGAYIVTFPYLMFFFKGISVIGILVNIIVVPVIPALMLTSSLALLMSVVSIPFAALAASISEWVSGAVLFIVHLFATISFGYLKVTIPAWVCLLLYICVFYGFYLLKKKVDLKAEI